MWFVFYRHLFSIILNASQVLNWHMDKFRNNTEVKQFFKKQIFNRWGYIWCNTQSLTSTSQDLEWVNNRDRERVEKREDIIEKKWSSRQAIWTHTQSINTDINIYITFECPIKLRIVSFICENKIIFSHDTTNKQKYEIINWVSYFDIQRLWRHSRA